MVVDDEDPGCLLAVELRKAESDRGILAAIPILPLQVNNEALLPQEREST